MSEKYSLQFGKLIPARREVVVTVPRELAEVFRDQLNRAELGVETVISFTPGGSDATVVKMSIHDKDQERFRKFFDDFQQGKRIRLRS